MKIQFVSCHRKPERSFFWNGKQFPVCARCTGIHIGYLSFPFFNFEILTLPISYALLLMLPTIVDGLIQAYSKYESNNSWRFVSGVSAGVGAMAAVVHIGTIIGSFILK